MGVVVNPEKAFSLCHGYKIGDHLILWSPGVVGTLSHEQDKLCREILIENAKGGERIFHSYEEALHAETYSKDLHLPQVALSTCAHILHKADVDGLIHGIRDEYALENYCMDRLGYGKGLKYNVPPEIQEFVDKSLEEMGDKLHAIRRIE